MSPEHIVIVDDDPLMVEVISKVLEASGYPHLQGFTDASAALRFTTDHRVDLIITDLVMPAMDGVEFLRKLSEEGYQGRVILISGIQDRILRSAMDQARLMELNLMGMVAKPLVPERLVAMVRRVLPTGDALLTNPKLSKLSIDDLVDAVAKGAIKVWYQPQVDLMSGDLMGVESLARWTHPDFGEVPPLHFIEMAELEGEIYPLTFRFMEQLCSEASALRDMGFNCSFSVNISPKLLTRLRLPDILEELCTKHGLPPSALTTEMVETFDLEDNLKALEILTRLRMKGFGVSIDDFGTGYSNVKRLMSLPFSEIKVDQYFIQGINSDPISALVVQNDLKIAEELGIRLVYEGLEEEQDLRELITFGGGIVQGFIVAEPMDLAKLVDWYDHWQSQGQKKWLDKVRDLQIP